MKRAFVFPGIAMQSIGIGKEIAAVYVEARRVFEEADEALGKKLSHLMFSGPLEEFDRMENKQPALLTSSIAVLRILENQTTGKIWDAIDCVGGHSFGEYAALCAIGSLDFTKTLRLMRDNAREMDRNPELKKGKMMALIGKELTVRHAQLMAEEAAQGQVCVVANDNGHGHIIVSGHSDAIDRIDKIAARLGVRLRLPLNHGVPAHSPLMASVVPGIRELLKTIEVKIPRVAFVTNSGVVEVRPKVIGRMLPDRVVRRVQWRNAVKTMCQRGVQEFIECGPAPLLKGMIDRIAPHTQTFSMHTPKAIDDFLNRWTGSLPEGARQTTADGLLQSGALATAQPT